MKKGSMLIISGLLTVFTAKAQLPAGSVSAAAVKPVPAVKEEVLLLKETGHDFGKIPQGRPVNYGFDIVNTGREALRLENVQASCGCTTPEWTKEPIAAGASSTIKVGYNAYAEGHFTKTVTIFYNSNQTKTITISGEVYKLPATSAPENGSVQFLKQTNQ